MVSLCLSAGCSNKQWQPPTYRTVYEKIQIPHILTEPNTVHGQTKTWGDGVDVCFRALAALEQCNADKQEIRAISK